MSTDRPIPKTVGGTAPIRSAREIALEAEVAALEAEIDRREKRLRELVDSYEALLDTQARAGREADAFVWTDGGPTEGRAVGSGLADRLRAHLPTV